jgi:RAT1-interacting protein
MLVCLTRWAVNSTYKKWYLQSRMLGIGNIFLGRRDFNDVLRETEWIRVDHLPARVEGWDPQEDVDKGARILNALREFCRTQNGDDHKVWRVVCGVQKAVSGMVSVASGVHVRELSLAERDIISSRRGERIGVITKHAVENLRS